MMRFDDAYFRWFDDDQHRRGMTDYLPDELQECADQEAEKAPVAQLFRKDLTPHGVERAPRGAVSGEGWGPAACHALGRHVGTGKPHDFNADSPPWKDAA